VNILEAFDPDYVSISFDDVWCSHEITDCGIGSQRGTGLCPSLCQQEHPKATGWPSGWKEGEFECASAIGETFIAWSYWCVCSMCQKDCSLNEGIAKASEDKCVIADITKMETRLYDQIGAGITSLIGETLISMTPVDPFTAGAMSIAFGALQETLDDSSDPMDFLIADINEMKKNLIDCVEQKIAISDAEDIIDEMEKALDAYDDAEDTGADSTVEDKRDMVYNAWDKFTDLQFKLNNNNIIGKETINFQMVLGPLQYFSAFFAATATDYLRYLYEFDADKTDATFNGRLEKTLRAMDVISIWTHAAKASIAGSYMDALKQLPCRNAADLEAELANWMKDFDEAHIFPVNGYIQQIHRLDKTDENVCGSVQSIDIVSVDHVTGTTGMYFNFDASQVDDIFKGRTDWSSVVLDMDYKGKTIVVKLWRSGNGGTYPSGDYPHGHGRIDPDHAAAEHQFTQSETLIFRKELCGE